MVVGGDHLAKMSIFESVPVYKRFVKLKEKRASSSMGGACCSLLTAFNISLLLPLFKLDGRQLADEAFFFGCAGLTPLYFLCSIRSSTTHQ